MGIIGIYTVGYSPSQRCIVHQVRNTLKYFCVHLYSFHSLVYLPFMTFFLLYHNRLACTLPGEILYIPFGDFLYVLLYCLQYVANNYIIITQIQCAFCNLTWFLTGHGYNNEENIDECKKILGFMSLFFNMNLSNWNLNQVGFARANLADSKLNNVNLKKAHMSDANLCGADFRYADLSGANLSGAELSGAEYCLDKRCETIFPDGFNPEKHGMIEVNFWGNPVKNRKQKMINDCISGYAQSEKVTDTYRF